MKKILVIEDEEAVRSNITELLTQEGFETFEAENGRAGINLAKKIIPDLIISDILMPEIDGFGVLQELQNNILTSSIPFIFLTARTDIADIRMGMREGADDYLTKPYKAADLLDAINSRLNKRKNIDRKVGEIFQSVALSLPHELRTPLISILGFSQIIKEDFEKFDSAEILEMLDQINSSGYELLSLIEKFLTFSHLETLVLDTSQLLRFSESYTHSSERNTNIIAYQVAEKSNRKNDLKITIEDAPLKIYNDHYDILIKEIIENCFKFSRPGTPVEISAKNNMNSFEIIFTDYGIGMSDEQIKNIGLLRQFNRKKYHQNGTGMGLAIVNKLAEIYHIDIKIFSHVNRFTTVKLSIPVCQ